ncbi:fungal-specific transcription factor domain-containing protein [Aspergillus cavernicola]|uniref:Fungal-specific transcription factor domain-containing protein n=1 Tax=Aspergillus cavernicola TaxID=176166 RepID=A0ABR4I269_9EURO
MFIAFEATQNREEGPSNPKHGRRSERISRRGVIPRACGSCRRRKVKCDGRKPCEACRWYKKPELCCYTEHQQSQNALERLFPGSAPEDIVNLPREKLLELVTTSGSQQNSPTVAASIETSGSALSMDRPGLESLHSMPGEQLNESQPASAFDSAGHVSDDVNALSLLSRQPTSYLGVSSIQAALKAITWLHPESNLCFSQGVSHDHSEEPASPRCVPPPTEPQMLNAYFVNFQPFAPLLDEEAFRTTCLLGHRKDDQWLALLNIVLALGGITSAGNDTHRRYFERSMSHLNLAWLGNPSLEVVQALGLIGGWYCHYISQPNLAYSLMGAAVRMAVSLGLQREPCDNSPAPNPMRSRSQEANRRTWWSLCCLETWGHETLGRPSMDFFAPSITVNLPRLLDKENYLEILPLIENVQFVKIASKVQESLAALPTLTHTEMFNLDSQLLQWRNNLPPVLRDYEPCPESLYSVRTVMCWRFYNQRMLLYRPTLLSYAMRRVPLMAIRVEERTAIQNCREIAETTIHDISMTTNLNQVIGWNAVWLLFQATMVPLVVLYALSAGDDNAGASFEACKAQIETAILTFDRLKPYGHTAGRSREVISSLLKAKLGDTDAEPADMSGGGFNSQGTPLPNALNAQQPRDQGLDLTTTSFDNISSQYMWEYLSWGVDDLWPDLSNFSQNEAMSYFRSAGGGP